LKNHHNLINKPNITELPKKIFNPILFKQKFISQKLILLNTICIKRVTTLGRVVLNHSTHIEGLIPVLKKLALNIRIKTITPAIISRVRGRSTNLVIRISVKTINGYKAIARRGKTAQEVFISTDLSKDELKKLLDFCNCG
jgi:hypothetical protein